MGVKVWFGPAMKPDAFPLGNDVLGNPTYADSEGVATMQPIKGVKIVGWTDSSGVEHSF